MNIRQNCTITIALALTAVLMACASADAVAKFASSSSTSLKQGETVFSDFPTSYLRGTCITTVTKVELAMATEDTTETCHGKLSPKQSADLAELKQEESDLTDISKAL